MPHEESHASVCGGPRPWPSPASRAAARGEDFKPYGTGLARARTTRQVANRNSHIKIFYPQRDSTTTSLGNWDGEEILKLTVTEDGMHWQHMYGTKDKDGKIRDGRISFVDATWITGGPVLKVKWKVYPLEDGEPNVAHVIASGEGVFTKSP